MTPKKRARFLEALAETGNVRQAAEVVQLSATTLYRHRHQEAAFAEAWEAARAMAADLVLEPEAVRRAVEGVDKPVYQQGERVGSVREYSDTLLIFLLKGAKPATYRERVEHSGPKGGPLQITVVYEDA